MRLKPRFCTSSYLYVSPVIPWPRVRRRRKFEKRRGKQSQLKETQAKGFAGRGKAIKDDHRLMGETGIAEKQTTRCMSVALTFMRRRQPVGYPALLQLHVMYTYPSCESPPSRGRLLHGPSNYLLKLRCHRRPDIAKDAIDDNDAGRNSRPFEG